MAVQYSKASGTASKIWRFKGTLVSGKDVTFVGPAGEATIDGSGSFLYRIDVKDVNEPGKGFDTYRIRIPSKPYDSGEHVLEGGNIQIHK